MSDINYIPVILNEEHNYSTKLNQEADESLRLLYDTQIFPQKGEYILSEGWDPIKVTGRDFVLWKQSPMIYLITTWPDWEQEDKEDLTEEQFEGMYYDYHDRSKIYTQQKEILKLD